MQILYVTPAVAPYHGSGDLAEISGALPAALQGLGMKVTVVAPFWKGVRPEQYGLARRIRKLTVPLGNGSAEVGFLEGKLRNADVSLLLLDHPESFQTEDGKGNEHRRYYLLARAALEAARELSLNVDLVHANGWESGFVPLLLQDEAVPALAGVKLVFTIPEVEHNQLFEPGILEDLQLGYRHFNPEGIEFHGRVNLIKAGVLHADRLIVWSERYARELQTEEHGAGLHGLFRAHAGKLRGILHGLDPATWSPMSDHRLAERFDGDSLTGKEACKRALQSELNLPVRPQLPLLLMTGPLNPGRGADILLRALPSLLAQKLQLVLLGPTAPELTGPLSDAVAANTQNLAYRPEIDEDLLHRALAGADVLLALSAQDPAGLLVTKALRYGTLPLCRRVGALADLVIDTDPTSGSGNGFCTGGSREDLERTALRALSAYGQRRLWLQLTRTAMRQTNNLELSARRTLEVYQSALDQA